MRKVSVKQAKKNREVGNIKKDLPLKCAICGTPCTGDAAHILPKSNFPEYYIHPLNPVRLCRTCHNLFDNDIEFRKKQTKLYEQALKIDQLAARRYFRHE